MGDERVVVQCEDCGGQKQPDITGEFRCRWCDDAIDSLMADDREEYLASSEWEDHRQGLLDRTRDFRREFTNQWCFNPVRYHGHFLRCEVGPDGHEGECAATLAQVRNHRCRESGCYDNVVRND